MAEIIPNEANEMTPVVESKISKKDKVLTGFCLTGAAVGIGHAVFEGGKWLKNKFFNEDRKAKRAEKKAQKAEKKEKK